MATALERETTGRRASMIVAVLVLLALIVWAGTAGQDVAPEVHHPSPGTVEHVEGSDLSTVILTPDGAEKIGLQLARAERTDHPAGKLMVPHAALIHGADGTVWVYTSTDGPLRFRRQEVEVVAVKGRWAILSRGLTVGTAVVARASAELYGTEFEVGH